MGKDIVPIAKFGESVVLFCKSTFKSVLSLKPIRVYFVMFLLGVSCGVLTSAPFYFFVQFITLPFAWFLFKEAKHINPTAYNSFWHSVTIWVAYVYGYFVGSLSWLSAPLAVDTNHIVFMLIAPFLGALLAVVIFSLFFMPLCLLVFGKNSKTINSTLECILFAISWCAGEIFRSNFVLNGFPWYTIGMAATVSPRLMYLAAYFGSFAGRHTRHILDFIVALLAISPLLIFYKHISPKKYFFGFALIIGCIFGGSYLYVPIQEYKLPFNTEKTQQILSLIGVQGNVSKKLAYEAGGQYEARTKAFKQYFGFSKRLITEEYKDIDTKLITPLSLQHLELIRHVQKNDITKVLVWPEGGLSFYHIDHVDPLYPMLGELINGFAEAMIFPSIVIEGGDVGITKDSGSSMPEKLFNAITAIDNHGRLLGLYKKRHLVPFGEYIPLRRWMPMGLQILIGLGDLTPSDEKKMRHIVINHTRIAPVICYDIIFHDDVKDGNDMLPDIILNVSNDAWFGKSIGFYQHFVMARLAAVIAGVPVFRVANNGITAYIDKYGRVVNRVDIDSMEFLEVKIKSRYFRTVITKEDEKAIGQAFGNFNFLNNLSKKHEQGKQSVFNAKINNRAN